MNRCTFWIPVAVGTVALGAMAMLSLRETNAPARTPASPRVATRDVQVPTSINAAAKPDEAMRKIVMRAISAAAMRDRPRRESALAELRRDPDRAMAAINDAMKQAKNPEYVR